MSGEGEPIVEVHTASEIPPEVAEAAAAAVVAEAEAAVAIAEVHAEASVAIAEVEADASVARAEVQAEETASIMGAVTREEMEECRRNSEEALTLARATQSTLDSLAVRLSPPNPVESPDDLKKTEPPGDTKQAPAPETAPAATEPEKPKKSKVRWT